MEQPELRDPYTEVADRRQRGHTIQQIHDDVGSALGISRSEVGRLAKRWVDEEGGRKELMRLVDWGKITDVDWKALPSGIPVEAVPFLLRIGWPSLTVAEAKFCWKMKQAAPDIPPYHALSLLRIFRQRFPLELRGEEVDYSDVWAYLGRSRWAGREEETTYVGGVAHGWWPPIDHAPPDRRSHERVQQLRDAYTLMETFIRLDLDPLDAKWDKLKRRLEDMRLLLSSLPTTPWDPREALNQDTFRRTLEQNKEQIIALIEQDEASEEDNHSTENERSDES